MKLFKLSDMYSVVCTWNKTGYGFRHVATLIKNGQELGQAKACYYNRTWERYEYETVLKAVVSKFFGGVEEKFFMQVIEGGF